MDRAKGPTLADPFRASSPHAASTTPTASLKLLHGREGDKSCQQIYAEKDGEYAVVLSYQLQIQKRGRNLAL
jgi:hypothetical protein